MYHVVAMPEDIIEEGAKSLVKNGSLEVRSGKKKSPKNRAIR
jgi:HSP20 family molecular chaperone IbpA